MWCRPAKEEADFFKSISFDFWLVLVLGGASQVHAIMGKNGSGKSTLSKVNSSNSELELLNFGLLESQLPVLSQPAYRLW